MLKDYLYLMRFHRPIGIYLLLWPTLWALWLAGNGKPNLIIVSIFILGVILMRAAGCIINDYADRNWDAHVERTKDRPIASGKITPKKALILFFILLFCAFLLVLNLNRFTILLAFVGAGLAAFYPFMKRFTHLPQMGLGAAYSWGIPMAFAAELNSIPSSAWILFIAAVVWPVIYDTMYALVDKPYDEKIGIKSTAILFGHHNSFFIGILQIVFLVVMLQVGYLFKLHWPYYVSLTLSGLLFIRQLRLIKDNDPNKCFQAFLNNNWVGMIIFAGIFLGIAK